MFIFEHSKISGMNFRNEIAEEGDLLNVIERFEAYLKNVDQGQKNSSQDESRNRSNY
jgi:hypothetical protein